MPASQLTKNTTVQGIFTTSLSPKRIKTATHAADIYKKRDPSLTTPCDAVVARALTSGENDKKIT
jgi:hypothetical protein